MLIISLAKFAYGHNWGFSTAALQRKEVTLLPTAQLGMADVVCEAPGGGQP